MYRKRLVRRTPTRDAPVGTLRVIGRAAFAANGNARWCCSGRERQFSHPYVVLERGVIIDKRRSIRMELEKHMILSEKG